MCMQMPKGWRWLNRLSPATWIIYGLAVDQLGENDSIMTAPDGTQQTVAEFMKSYFGYDYSFRWSALSLSVCAATPLLFGKHPLSFLRLLLPDAHTLSEDLMLHQVMCIVPVTISATAGPVRLPAQCSSGSIEGTNVMTVR